MSILYLYLLCFQYRPTCSFTCSLFNDHDSNVTASNVYTTVNKKLERTHGIWSNLRYNPVICLHELTVSRKNFRQWSRCSCPSIEPVTYRTNTTALVNLLGHTIYRYFMNQDGSVIVLAECSDETAGIDRNPCFSFQRNYLCSEKDALWSTGCSKTIWKRQKTKFQRMSDVLTYSRPNPSWYMELRSPTRKTASLRSCSIHCKFLSTRQLLWAIK